YSVHYNDYAAKLQGAQIAYDVGIQRTSWQIHSLTNWMGDAGTLKAITGQYRSHVYLSDVVRLGGRVEAKEVDAEGSHVVRLKTWARNQRDQNVMPGTAVIALPRRADGKEKA
ncbi:MAG: acyl dehydratase, partial [Proteobacteria bacterium]|nr:acyl dehydratase [Pseudomonadota bacterium]